MSAAAPLTNATGLAAATFIVGLAMTSRLRGQARVPLSTRSRNSVNRAHRIVPSRRTVRVGTGLPALFAALWLVGPVLCLALAVAAAGGVRSLPIIRQRQTQRQLARAVPDALDLVVVLLQAGATPRQTVIELSRRGPRSTRQGFAATALQLERGHSFGEAIGALRRQLGDAITPFVELISASERCGLPTAQVVQQLSNETRALRRRTDEAAARSLPVKLSFPLVMCTLPSFVLLAIAPAVLAALSSLGSHAW
jgi:tight adherence protein C